VAQAGHRSLLGKLFLVLLLVDTLTWLLDHLRWAEVTVFGEQVASAMLALCILPHTIMRQATLPDPVVQPHAKRTPWHALRAVFRPVRARAGARVVIRAALPRGDD
jgi:hypothetical protein